MSFEHLVDEPGRRLAIPLWLFGSLRRDAHRIKRLRAQFEQFDHAGIARLDLGQREHAATDAGLVGEQEELHAGAPGPGQCLTNAWQQGHIGRIPQVRNVLDQRAISIEKDSLKRQVDRWACHDNEELTEANKRPFILSERQ